MCKKQILVVKIKKFIQITTALFYSTLNFTFVQFPFLMCITYYG